MNQPIAFMTKRYRCPHCPRTGSGKARVAEHIGRCWQNPAVKGCKTCRHFEPAGGGSDHGVHEWNPAYDESCDRGVELNRNYCAECDKTVKRHEGCPVHPLAEIVKAGPIVHCDLWEAVSS